MAKHKTREEGLYGFKQYEESTLNWDEYFEFSNIVKREYAKDWFRRKYGNYINQGESIIISMTGKKSTGRPKKEKEISWDDFTRDELIEIAKRYKELNKNKRKSDKDKEVKSLSLPKTKIAGLLSISRTGMYYKKKSISKRDHEIEKVILKTFNEFKGIFGRDRIAAVTGINYRRVGRYMKAMGLKCKIRKARRTKETKVTNVVYKDLVNREYNKKDVIATDVSYIKVNSDFCYLSIAIDHYTKRILSGNLSRFNDNHLVLKHFFNMNLENKIVHSDHGNQYSSSAFVKLSREKKFKISMSRVGNSLDNREAEYFFSNLKSEFLKFRTLSSFSEAKEQIGKYIKWYNTKRVQSVLQGKTPDNFALVSL